MSCASAAPFDRDQQPSRQIFEMVPAWLVSLVVHLSLVLLLALFSVIGEGGWRDRGIVLDCQTNDADGADEETMLAAAIEVPSELTPAPQVEAETPELTSLVPQPQVASQIDLVSPAAQTGTEVGTAIDGDPGDAPTNATQTSVFGLAAEGETFVYVFDRSDSMNSTLTYTSEGTTVFSITPLAAAKAELLRSLGDLDRGQQFHILFYNHEVWMFDPGSGSSNRMVAATAKNKERAAAFVAGVYGHGNTRHIKPLEIALRMRPDVIFLLTDGEAKDDPTDDQLTRLKRLNDGRTRINVIQFCYATRTESLLVRLAQENGGRHVFMNITNLGPGMAGIAK